MILGANITVDVSIKITESHNGGAQEPVQRSDYVEWYVLCSASTVLLRSFAAMALDKHTLSHNNICHMH